MKALVDTFKNKFVPDDYDYTEVVSLAANTLKTITFDKTPKILHIFCNFRTGSSGSYTYYDYIWFGNSEWCISQQWHGGTQDSNDFFRWNDSSIVHLEDNVLTIKHTSATRKYTIYAWY